MPSLVRRVARWFLGSFPSLVLLACGGSTTSTPASADAGGDGPAESLDGSHEADAPLADAAPRGSKGQLCSQYTYCVQHDDAWVCDCNQPSVGPACAADAGASQGLPCDPNIPPCVTCSEGTFQGCTCDADAGAPGSPDAKGVWSCLGGGSDTCG